MSTNKRERKRLFLDASRTNIHLISANGQDSGPCLMTLVDLYSRRVLAAYVGFDRPAFVAAMKTMLEVVKQGTEPHI